MLVGSLCYLNKMKKYSNLAYLKMFASTRMGGTFESGPWRPRVQRALLSEAT